MAATLDGYDGFQYFLVSSPTEYVAHVQINRPEKLNAFCEAMWLEMGQVFRKLSYDSNVRAVVFSAVGERAFTSGLDVQAASTGGILSRDAKMDGSRFATGMRRHVDEFQESISAIEKCEKRVFTPSLQLAAIRYHILNTLQPLSWPCMVSLSVSPSTCPLAPISDSAQRIRSSPSRKSTLA